MSDLLFELLDLVAAVSAQSNKLDDEASLNVLMSQYRKQNAQIDPIKTTQVTFLYSSRYLLAVTGVHFDSPVLKASALINRVIYSNFPYQNSAI